MSRGYLFYCPVHHAVHEHLRSINFQTALVTNLRDFTAIQTQTAVIIDARKPAKKLKKLIFNTASSRESTDDSIEKNRQNRRRPPLVFKAAAGGKQNRRRSLALCTAARRRKTC